MTVKEEHHLDALNRKHQDLEKKLRTLQESTSVDDLEIQKIKQEKLRVKDEIFSFKRKMANEILAGNSH